MSDSAESLRNEARQLAGSLPIKPLTKSAWLAAADLYEASATPDYADSWTYVTQAANGHDLELSPTGYYAKGTQAFCVAGIFPRPHTGELAVHLINPAGPRAAALVAKLCMEIRRVCDCAIYLKKADLELCRDLEATGNFTWDDSMAWHPQAPQEDDTYPVLLLDVDQSLALFEAGRLNQVRDKYARFLNRTKQREVAWHPLSPKRYTDARAVIQRFFHFKAEDHIDISKPCDYENMLTNSSESWNADSLVRQICSIDGQAAAILVMERIGKSNALGLYCNLALYQDHKYLSEFVIHRALKVAKEREFRYLNIGGSESQGLHTFKQKFHPVDQETRRWLIFKGRAG